MGRDLLKKKGSSYARIIGIGSVSCNGGLCPFFWQNSVMRFDCSWQYSAMNGKCFMAGYCQFGQVLRFNSRSQTSRLDYKNICSNVSSRCTTCRERRDHFPYIIFHFSSAISFSLCCLWDLCGSAVKVLGLCTTESQRTQRFHRGQKWKMKNGKWYMENKLYPFPLRFHSMLGGSESLRLRGKRL